MQVKEIWSSRPRGFRCGFRLDFCLFVCSSLSSSFPLYILLILFFFWGGGGVCHLAAGLDDLDLYLPLLFRFVWKFHFFLSRIYNETVCFQPTKDANVLKYVIVVKGVNIISKGLLPPTQTP